jgi:hypothetical protein
MLLLDIVAVPHPAGNRVDISWTLPASPAFPRVRVVRREATHPTTPNPASDAEGVVVPEIPGQDSAVDTGLRGETVYYYGLFPYATAGPGNTIVVSDPSEQIDSLNRTSAMATSPLGLADEMYALLPLIYHRYDTVLPRSPASGMSDEDQARGALRRFLELPGGQLDQVYSYARALLDVVDLGRVDGNLLPLLAQWIGWSTDYSLEIETQRNEIRNAPQIYKTIGVIPVIEATVKRISGEESRTKEFVHNVAATNWPERLNLWQRVRTGGTWDQAQLLSLDASFDGRAVAVRQSPALLWLFYHTVENGRWSIWSKTLSPAGWTPSEPVSESALILKDPSAAMQGTRLLLFWGAYDSDRDRWRIESRSRSGNAWSPIETFVPPEGNDAIQRRHPVAVADDTGGIWLFWLERVGSEWVLKYNRHDGATWQVNPSPTFPADAGQPPRVLDDVSAVFHPTDAGQRLWVFWARQDAATTPGQKRWTVAYRVKAGLNPATTADWSQIRTLPKAAGDDDHDREPSPRVQPGVNLEVFWSSHRGGRWSVWRNVLNRTTHAWGAPEDLGTPPYSMHAPVGFTNGAETVLVFRSSESMRYTSAVYGATETVDFRYSGSITVDTRHTAKLALRGKFDDFGTYIYDAGRGGLRTNDDWYARDTVGVYIAADPDGKEISRLNQVLKEFMPVTDRAVFIKDS